MGPLSGFKIVPSKKCLECVCWWNRSRVVPGLFGIVGGQPGVHLQGQPNVRVSVCSGGSEPPAGSEVPMSCSAAVWRGLPGRDHSGSEPCKRVSQATEFQIFLRHDAGRKWNPVGLKMTRLHCGGGRGGGGSYLLCRVCEDSSGHQQKESSGFSLLFTFKFQEKLGSLFGTPPQLSAPL